MNWLRRFLRPLPPHPTEPPRSGSVSVTVGLPPCVLQATRLPNGWTVELVLHRDRRIEVARALREAATKLEAK